MPTDVIGAGAAEESSRGLSTARQQQERPAVGETGESGGSSSAAATVNTVNTVDASNTVETLLRKLTIAHNRNQPKQHFPFVTPVEFRAAITGDAVGDNNTATVTAASPNNANSNPQRQPDEHGGTIFPDEYFAWGWAQSKLAQARRNLDANRETKQRVEMALQTAQQDRNRTGSGQRDDAAVAQLEDELQRVDNT
ncbi:LOW QUALITY PROTEIN: hypothetical protein ColTof3_14787 [Colletotrichum tofieldiae]|nr:LOW QUALITY PROTEIN: hypothetical protein ColTof3_14787 [Colletotrichum tofieldiae]